MTIPLDLGIRIHVAGLELLGGVQNAIIGTGEVARSQAAAGLGRLARSFREATQASGTLPPEVASAISGLQALSQYAGLIAPASLDMLADALERSKQAVIEKSAAYAYSTFTGDKMRAVIESLTPAETQLLSAINSTIEALRNQATAMQVTTQTSIKTEKAAIGTAVATRRLGRQAYMSAYTGMNVLSSVTQGLMMGMGALRGNLMSVGFGLIFLRYSIAPVTLGITALVMAIGGALKAISFVGPAFEKLVAGPMNRIKAAVVEAMGYFSGAVWVRIIAPSVRILADLAERFRNLALQTWLSAEVQRVWGELLGMVQGTFQNLSRTIKEHGGILRWVVRTGFITAINVLKGLVYLINVAINVLPQLAYLWKNLSGHLKTAWNVLGLVASGFKALGLEGLLQKLKEFTLSVTLEEILLLALGVLTGTTAQALLAAGVSLAADLVADLLGIDSPEFRRKWRTFWDWVAVGVFTGLVFGQPILIGIGALLGAMLALKEELFVVLFDIRAKIAEFALSVGRLVEPVIEAWRSITPFFLRGPLDTMLESLRKGMGKAEAEVARHDLWASLGKPTPRTTEEWFMPLDEWLEKMKKDLTLGGGGLLKGFTAKGLPAPAGVAAGWSATWTPYLPAGGGGAGGVGGDVYITVTGNNMYGKLDEDTAKVWAGQIGYALTARLATRKGIALR